MPRVLQGRLHRDDKQKETHGTAGMRSPLTQGIKRMMQKQHDFIYNKHARTESRACFLTSRGQVRLCKQDLSASGNCSSIHIRGEERDHCSAANETLLERINRSMSVAWLRSEAREVS